MHFKFVSVDRADGKTQNIEADHNVLGCLVLYLRILQLKLFVVLRRHSKKGSLTSNNGCQSFKG